MIAEVAVANGEVKVGSSPLDGCMR